MAANQEARATAESMAQSRAYCAQLFVSGGYGVGWVNSLVWWAYKLRTRGADRRYRELFGYLDPGQVLRELERNPAWRPAPEDLEYSGDVHSATETCALYTFVNTTAA